MTGSNGIVKKTASFQDRNLDTQIDNLVEGLTSFPFLGILTSDPTTTGWGAKNICWWIYCGTPTAIVIRYWDGGRIQNFSSDYHSVLDVDFDADTFLYAAVDDTPVATSPADVLVALSGHAGATFDWNDQDLIGIGDIVLGDGKYIGQVAGPKITFDDTNNLLKFTDATNFHINPSSDNNLIMGSDAGNIGTISGDNNVVFGHDAGSLLAAGYENVLIGQNCGKSLDAGNNNVLIGKDCGPNLTMTNRVIAIGDKALFSGVTKPSRAIAIGFQAIYNATAGAGLIGIGVSALYANTIGTHNIGIGMAALASNQDGGYNIAIGDYAIDGGVIGFSNVSRTIAIGYFAGTNLQTGADHNILIGFQAGDILTTGSDNIIIGYDIDPSANDASNELNIGGAITGDLSTGDIKIAGTFGLTTCIDAAADVDKFLVLDVENNVDYRTGAEVLSDIGASASGHTHDDRYYTETEIDTWRNSVTQTEMGYLDGVTSDIQTQLNGKEAAGISVLEADFNADTFLYASADNTPLPTSPANVLAALSGHAGAAFDLNSQNLTGVGDIIVGNSSWIGLGAAAERLEFYSAGYAAFMGCNVGIGTTTPSGKLHIYSGDLLVDGNIVSYDLDGNSYIILKNSGSTNNNAFVFQGSDGVNEWYLGQFSDGGIFEIKGFESISTRLAIDNSGNVGIGVTDPDTLLELYKVGAPQLKLSGGAADYATFEVAADGDLEIKPVGGNVKIDGAISSKAMTVTAANDGDAIDVSGVNTIWVDTSDGDVIIGGTVGGVDGQSLCIVVHDPTNNVTVEDKEGTGNQDFYLHKGADETLTGEMGGWEFVNHGGGHWHDVSHAKHV